MSEVGLAGAEGAFFFGFFGGGVFGGGEVGVGGCGGEGVADWGPGDCGGGWSGFDRWLWGVEGWWKWRWGLWCGRGVAGLSDLTHSDAARVGVFAGCIIGDFDGWGGGRRGWCLGRWWGGEGVF